MLQRLDSALPPLDSTELLVNFLPEEIHVLATRLAAYVSSVSTTAKVTNQQTLHGLI